MSEKSPYISFCGRQNRIQIGAHILRLLGEPTHVTILINEELTQFAIKGCEADNLMSFPVQVRKQWGNRVEIKSKQFVSDIMLRNHWNMSKSYRVSGVYMAEENAVSFNLKNAVEF